MCAHCHRNIPSKEAVPPAPAVGSGGVGKTPTGVVTGLQGGTSDNRMAKPTATEAAAAAAAWIGRRHMEIIRNREAKHE